ncbi:hypothetical protein CEP54_001891 [Fusarium duplospermum]|uniref:Uncharacterized protein n=1 Tax=Fusarium duplospermum TaxID=1325734 RepID=A0A428QY80_9HYPO|nr:hypothetical protein CEP54_001891 [Fusarium duplospermum]
MGKVSLNLPIHGGRGQPNETEDQRLKPHLHEDELPDYDKFPYSTFFPENHKGKDKSKDPVLDKSSPEYRERVKKTLDALQGEYQKAYEQYKDTNSKVLATREERDQLLWNLAVLDIRNVAEHLESMDSIHEDVGKIQREVRDQNKPDNHATEYHTLCSNRWRAKHCLYRIEIALEAGLREFARLDGVDSDAFRQLRSMWARRQSHLADEESQYSANWSEDTIQD